jgi:hypothetical protein
MSGPFKTHLSLSHLLAPKNHFLKETGPSKKHPKVDEQEPLPDSHVSMNNVHCSLVRFCSYGIILACIFATCLCCDGMSTFLVTRFDLLCSSLVFLNLMVLLREILGKQVLEQ